MGDIYLDARLPLGAVTPEEIDRLLGAVLEYADGSFNTILELGFASSIRKEWEWRVSRGEPIRNLEAFRGPLALDELGARREEGCRSTRLTGYPAPSAVQRGGLRRHGSAGRARGLRRATATPTRASTPPA